MASNIGKAFNDQTHWMVRGAIDNFIEALKNVHSRNDFVKSLRYLELLDNFTVGISGNNVSKCDFDKIMLKVRSIIRLDDQSIFTEIHQSCNRLIGETLEELDVKGFLSDDLKSCIGSVLAGEVPGSGDERNNDLSFGPKPSN